MKRNYRRTTIKPRLEALEDRACPSCTTSLVDGVLSIAGDELANNVAITDRGALGVRVACDGMTTDFTEVINRITVNTGGGNDVVRYQREGPDMLRQRLDFDLGDGDDRILLFAADGLAPSGAAPPEITFLTGDGNDNASVFISNTTGGMSLLGDLGAGDDSCDLSISSFAFEFSEMAPVQVALYGGDGNDRMRSDGAIGDSASLTLSVDVGNGNDQIINDTWIIFGNATMVTNSLGGNGDDFIFETYVGNMTGTFVGNADGGNGADIIDTALGWDFDFLNIEAGGQASYDMTGGNGDDLLRFICVGRIDGQLDVQADGGNGNDTIDASQMWVNVLSVGQLTADFLGGNGDDEMEVQLQFITTELIEFGDGTFFEFMSGFTDTPAPLSELSVLANGGRGFDTCSFFGPVQVLGCEVVTSLVP